MRLIFGIFDGIDSKRNFFFWGSEENKWEWGDDGNYFIINMRLMERKVEIKEGREREEFSNIFWVYIYSYVGFINLKIFCLIS